VAADVGAYFIGKRFGQTRLTKISPNKTVEGALGGLVGSVSVVAVFGKFFQEQIPIFWCILFGTFIFFTSVFGDLLESVMKRDAGFKDSGDLIPGHGGLLDRIDSFMLTGVLGYSFTKFCIPFYK